MLFKVLIIAFGYTLAVTPSILLFGENKENKKKIKELQKAIDTTKEMLNSLDNRVVNLSFEDELLDRRISRLSERVRDTKKCTEDIRNE